jgi:hypothetical protein
MLSEYRGASESAVMAGVEEAAGVEFMSLSEYRHVVTVAVGDSIRSKIVKPKKAGPAEKKTVGQPINGSANEP